MSDYFTAITKHLNLKPDQTNPLKPEVKLANFLYLSELEVERQLRKGDILRKVVKDCLRLECLHKFLLI